MEWLTKRSRAVLATAIVVGGVIAFAWPGASPPLTNQALADKLGDQGPLGLRGTVVDCTSRSGTVLGHRYNRVCTKGVVYGYCESGTGETKDKLFVLLSVRKRQYEIVYQEEDRALPTVRRSPLGRRLIRSSSRFSVRQWAANPASGQLGTHVRHRYRTDYLAAAARSTEATAKHMTISIAPGLSG